MTLIKYGNNLLTPVPQTGWTIEEDGFGLFQTQVKFKWDGSKHNEFPTVFTRGKRLDALIPDVGSNYAAMTMWKANVTVEKNETLTVTADFVGIDPAKNGGTKTETQVAMTGASASEAIEHHPNFLIVNSPTGTPALSNKLAGFPPLAGGFVDDPVLNPNRALWTPKVAGGGATQGFQFVGFLPNQKASEYPDHLNIKAGIKNYYKPSITLRCLFYVNDEETAVGYASYVGWITSGETYGLDTNYKELATGTYGGAFKYTAAWLSRIHRSFLITNCSVERFGSIYKVTADLMLSGISGWDRDIYPKMDE